ncbi:MAG TPA: hypothetical protein DEB24_06990 [Coriobacteriia bacterium]|nr:hypothetical protein [Coriobacteriia bacterium]
MDGVIPPVSAETAIETPAAVSEDTPGEEVRSAAESVVEDVSDATSTDTAAGQDAADSAPSVDPTAAQPSSYGDQPVQAPYGGQQPVQQAPFDPAQPYPAPGVPGTPDPYGAPPQSPYGAPNPAYYQPQPGMGAVPEPPKKKKTWIILLVVGIVLICCIVPCILGTVFYNDISKALFGYTTTVTTPGSKSGSSPSGNPGSSNSSSSTVAPSYTLVDSDGIKITVDEASGYYDTALAWYEVAVKVENNTDKELDIYFGNNTAADGYDYLEAYIWPATDDTATTFSANKTHSGEMVFFDIDGKGLKNITGSIKIYDYRTDKLIGEYKINIPSV